MSLSNDQFFNYLLSLLFDFKKIYDEMHQPAFLFDGRNLLDLEALREIGFEASGVGKG